MTVDWIWQKPVPTYAISTLVASANSMSASLITSTSKFTTITFSFSPVLCPVNGCVNCQ